MKLIDLTPQERAALALALGKSPKYLYQLAVGAVDGKTGKRREITPELARAAVRFDGRLTLHELRPDIWDAPRPLSRSTQQQDKAGRTTKGQGSARRTGRDAAEIPSAAAEGAASTVSA